MAIRGRPDHHLTAGHALADIVVGVTLEVHVETAGIPDTKTLAGSSGQVQCNRVVVHAVVAV